MKKTVAIIAPMFDPFADRLNIDFSVKLKKSKEELTLENLYNLSNNNYNISKTIKRESIERDNVAAAGYYLLSLLRRSGYEAIIVSANDHISLQRAADADPIAVCISTTMLLEKKSVAAIIEQTRKVMGNVLIIIGGVLVWKSYNWFKLMEDNYNIKGYNEEVYSYIFPSTKSEINTDIIVVSPYGSQILINILKEIEGGKKTDFSKIPNIAIPSNDGHFVFTHRIDESVDHDTDYTYWDIVDNLPYRIPIRTSIGCPFRCGYCDFCFLYPKIAYRSIMSIKNELNTIKKVINIDSGTKRMINFTDDNVFITQDRAKDLCNMIIDSNIDLPWAGFIRSSSVTTDNIDCIRDSGLVRAWIGVESGDQEQLKRMNKKQNLNDLQQGIELLDINNISVHMSFVVGFPGEIEETIEKTIKFLNGINVSLSEYSIFPLVILPLSEISFPEFRKKWDIKGIFSSWSHKTMTSQQAIEYSCEIFKNVDNVPCFYPQENHFFAKKFSREIRKEVYKLRHLLTLQLMEGKNWKLIAQTFSYITNAMGLHNPSPSEEFINNLQYPSSFHGKTITL